MASVFVGAAGGLVLVGLFTLLGLAALAFLAAVAAGGLLLSGDARTRPVPDAPPGLGPVTVGRNERTGDAAHGEPRPSAVWVPPEQMPSPSATAEWSTERVCRAWRVSYLWLERAREAREVALVARLAGVRQAYLDELERRAPSGFAAWLTCGARAASDPGRYMRDARCESCGPSGSHLHLDRPATSGAVGPVDRRHSPRPGEENS
ncbi:hypothetical protein [Geodermatophilus sp. TF02-6]|uniref:hypothetical protein n=1 Tax=Geodermatophilus sp. TF02-6 TaxID=2250575 RepID=UPI0011BDE73D|nr:hypothetical protein [Geodermatophilus sp. TF02-6]